MLSHRIKSESTAQPQKIFELVKMAITQNFAEGALLHTILDTFQKVLSDKKLGNIAKDKVFDLFFSTEETQQAYQDLYQRIVDHVDKENLEPSLFEIDFDPTIVCENVNQWAALHINPDQRVSHSGDTPGPRKIRRIDTLAKLLALSPRQSTCTAVTIDTSETPRLIIATNVTFNGAQPHIREQLLHNIHLLKDYVSRLLAIAAENHELKHEYLTVFAKELTSKLKLIPEEIYLQAAMKILYTLVLDQETWSSEEKAAFDQQAPLIILLPELVPAPGEKQIALVTEHCYGKEITIEESHLLENIPTIQSIRHLHAEQLIAHYLFRIKRLPHDTPVQIGIQKLCCYTCYKSLTENYPNLSVRGHHGQTYQGVIDMVSGEQCKE